MVPPHALPLTWTTEHPVWVDQWPLTQEKREAALNLINEQLNLGHLIPSTSPWNTPIFVIKKKSGKWRLLQDLRAVNRVIKPMGALQPGLPSPVAIPLDYQMIVLDLKDCFFTIPLAPGDSEHFAFSVPSINLQEPSKRFQWTVLPQGMVNSPTLCQDYVSRAIQPFRENFPDVYCIHYMDDLLLAASSTDLLVEAFSYLQLCLQQANLFIAPEKIQRDTPFEYLGYLVAQQTVTPQKLTLRTESLKTLNDFQKFLGDLNWLRPSLSLTTDQLQPLFSILQGDSSPTSPRILTPEASAVIDLVSSKISETQVYRINRHLPLNLVILKPAELPLAVIWQDTGPLEWIHLALHTLHVINLLISLIAHLIIKGRRRCLQLFGHDPDFIICPLLTSKQVQEAFEFSLDWQIAVESFSGQFLYHLPNHKLLLGLHLIPTVPFFTLSKRPIEGAATIFIDANKTGNISIVYTTPQHKNITTDKYLTRSVQRAELYACYLALNRYEEPFNLYSDSQYVSRILPDLPSAYIISNDEELFDLFNKIKTLLNKRTHPLFVSHIRAHTNLPGPLTEGNSLADRYTHIYNTIIPPLALQRALESHQTFHQNSLSLRKQFHISREQARQIVKQCPICPQLQPQPVFAINPRGLLPNHLWQMDVTHYSSFGKLSYIHSSIDTYSGLLFASLHTGEAFKDVQNHLLGAFSFMGIPKSIKTDNGSAYISRAFQKFCDIFHITHSTGIPHNSTGQAIIERAHHTLKNMLVKLKKGDLFQEKIKYSPHLHLKMALYVLNFLTIHDDGQTPMERHWTKEVDPPLVATWKDPLSGEWHGPDPLLRRGRGYACVFPQNEETPRWIPLKWVRDVKIETPDGKPESEESEEEEA